jgi:hypothetical protein
MKHAEVAHRCLHEKAGGSNGVGIICAYREVVKAVPRELRAVS